MEPGLTEFRASATRSKVFESDFAGGKGYMEIGAEFDWPTSRAPAEARWICRLSSICRCPARTRRI